MKYILKIILVSCIWMYAGYIVIQYFFSKTIPMATIKTPGLEVNISDSDGWGVILKLLVAVLGTHAGIKIINRILK